MAPTTITVPMWGIAFPVATGVSFTMITGGVPNTMDALMDSLTVGSVVGSVAVGIVATLAFGCILLRKPAPKVHSAMIEARGNKHVTTSDGRLLEYCVCGDLKSGVVVYVQHGYGSTCEVIKDWDNIAKEKKVRLIGATMPGFGLSDSYPMGTFRRLSEWANDIAVVFSAESVKSCHLMGHSAGTVHVAALAQGLRDFGVEVKNVCAGAPITPDNVPGVVEGMSYAILFIKSLMSMRYIGEALSHLLATYGDVDRVIDDCPAPDVKAAYKRGMIEHEKWTKGLVSASAHASSHTYRGGTDNIGTLQEPIDHLLSFLSEHVKAGNAVGITVSPDDTTNPPGMAKYWFSSIKGSTLLNFESGWGHMHMELPPASINRQLDFLLTGKDTFDR